MATAAVEVRLMCPSCFEEQSISSEVNFCLGCAIAHVSALGAFMDDEQRLGNKIPCGMARTRFETHLAIAQYFSQAAIAAGDPT